MSIYTFYSNFTAYIVHTSHSCTYNLTLTKTLTHTLITLNMILILIFLSFFFSCSMWQCKACSESTASRNELLSHYQLKHPHFGRTTRYPCAYLSCPCSFKTWNALIIHHSRVHSTRTAQRLTEHTVFSCHICSCKALATERDFFSHITTHLRRNEIVPCPFLDCSFQSNIYGTFKSHKSRKHTPHTYADLKPGIVRTTRLATQTDAHSSDQEEDDGGEVSSVSSSPDLNTQPRELPGLIEQQLGAALLKLEYLVHVPGTAIDEFLQELHHLLSSPTSTVSKGLVGDILQSNNIQVDKSIIADIATAVCSATPVHKALEKGGPLSTSYQRRCYYNQKFGVVEPVTHVLNTKEKHTFQYVPILKSLQQILRSQSIVEEVLKNHRGVQHTQPDEFYEYKAPQDGSHFQKNSFLNNDELRISLGLYVDDFETCNPLGTSRRKHKLCAVYWIFGNLPPGSHSSLSSIYLALLAKTDHIKKYGYAKTFKPLLQDLKILEDQGVYIPLLGKSLKGTVQTVVADNLGAHSLAGFQESFSGDYYCRQCTAKSCDVQHHCVSSGVFGPRTKEQHESHAKSAQETGKSVFGVKRGCILSEHLSFFHVVGGYPPDLAHDLLEGIVPVELAHCLAHFISKDFFRLDDLNTAIRTFPFKWMDKTNKPNPVPRSFESHKSIGGNAHENWALLRLLPFLIGHCVPESEPAWLVLMDLKEIVELAVAPIHTDQSIAYLESKIVEHRQRYQEQFPGIRLLPKHHYVEHYPLMIRAFGPLVCHWTMRFEAKHSFFKQIVKHTSCFKNIPLTLASKHQLMIAFHMNSPSHGKSPLEVSDVSTVPIDVVKDEMAQAIQQRFPDTNEVHLVKKATSCGITYCKRMIVVHGTESGLPEFSEIFQMCVIDDRLFLIVDVLCAWYNEHYRAFALEQSSKKMKLVALEELMDIYPLCDYRVGRSRMVTLKRHIVIRGKI